MSTHIILYVNPSNEGFINPLILFSSLLAILVFLEFVWSYFKASYPSHKLCMKEEINRIQAILFSG